MVIECGMIGGLCINVVCILSKVLIYCVCVMYVWWDVV